MSAVQDKLDQEIEFFQNNFDELVKYHQGKFLLIKDQEVIGAYNDEGEAYQKGEENYEPGTFLIRFCDEEHKKQVQVFNSGISW